MVPCDLSEGRGAGNALRRMDCLIRRWHVLSIVIPTQNCERVLVRTLAMLVAGAAAGLVREVILADAGSTDATAEVGDIAGCRVLSSPLPLASRLKAAAAEARAPWLMFLRPGVVLEPTWVDETADFIECSAAQAAVFRRLPGKEPARPMPLEVLALIRLALGGRPRPQQGLVISRQLYENIGGHRAHSIDPEGDLLRRLGRKHLVCLRSGALQTGD